MINPKTVDRQDVAHPTNPIGGGDHVEETNLAGPLKPKAAKLPAVPDKHNPGRMDRTRAKGHDTVHVQSPRPAS